MERLYGRYACGVCHLPSSFGWVYCCTQEGEMEEAEQQEQQGKIKEPSSNCHAQPTRLSPWMEKAIAQGCYTPAQIIVLRAQKQKVLDTAAAAISRFKLEDELRANAGGLLVAASASARATTTVTASTTTVPLNANRRSSYPYAHKTNGNNSTAPLARHSISASRNPAPPNTESSVCPRCNYLACQYCRPTYRDRAWARFEDAFSNDHTAALCIEELGFESCAAPLAKLSVMRGIGLGKSVQKGNQGGLRTWDERDDMSPAQESVEQARGHLSRGRVEHESRGFRKSIREAVRKWIERREDSPSSSSSSAFNADVERLVTSSRWRKRKADVAGWDDEQDDVDEEAAEDPDMALWRACSDEVLEVASRIPLPAEDGCMDGLSERESAIVLNEERGFADGGIAVTEEAADLKAADVILSAV
ncbi:MAG: hypothetical protein Q9163_000243 [Psora crenata]